MISVSKQWKTVVTLTVLTTMFLLKTFDNNASSLPRAKIQSISILIKQIQWYKLNLNRLSMDGTD